jgi:hypothetical protein
VRQLQVAGAFGEAVCRQGVVCASIPPALCWMNSWAVLGVHISPQQDVLAVHDVVWGVNGVRFSCAAAGDCVLLGTHIHIALTRSVLLTIRATHGRTGTICHCSWPAVYLTWESRCVGSCCSKNGSG